MKKIFFSICIIFSATLFGQEISKNDVVGVYKEKSNDPVGGASLVFLPDQSFVIVYFGGIQKGIWELKEQKIIITKTAEPQFALYGRNLPTLKNKTQIKFSVEANNSVVVGLDSSKPSVLRPVFNQESNCFIYPYILSQEEKLFEIKVAQVSSEAIASISHSKDVTSAQVFHFDIPIDYNDLILINLKKGYTETWISQAIYKNEKLFLNPDDEGIKKRPLKSLSEEELAMINHFSKQNLFPKKIKSGDEFFPYAENAKSEQLIPFNRIKVLEISKKNIEIENKPFFIATCTED